MWSGVAQVRAALLVFLWLAAAPARAADPPPLAEHQIKALYLFNFTKYVEWPAAAFASTNAPFTIGLLAPAELQRDLLELTQGKNVNGREIRFRLIEKEQDLKSCQILFLGADDPRRAAQALGTVKDSAVLTVGEAEDFLGRGGMVNFVRKNNKLRLEINLEAAQRARLAISAKLLAVAEVVQGKLRLPKN